ncbi:uncharacterized protein [Cicer arietinum]|uniref:Uncharacterized protein LOC101489897 n=1 Tax=Cicer arietinum TaxID=3827 RepID=A0A1S2YZ35_CICAR|nr:uncharacterized protein LOC101489897 [Cicer arietinum]
MMEKLSQMKSTFLKFISKQPVSLVIFQNPTLSPCRSPTTQFGSIFPKEARRKHKSGISFSPKEPTSPKVSCIGQVKCKKKKKAKKEVPTKNIDSVQCPENKVLLWISKGVYEGGKQGGQEKVTNMLNVPPTLDAMKKFTSGRGSLYDFDFTLAER